MNELTEQMSKRYNASAAIIIYECVEANRSIYLESRKISNGQMGAGAPVTENTLFSLVKLIKKEPKLENITIGGIIPDNLLFFKRSSTGHTEMLWYRPAEMREMIFSESLHIPNGKTLVPALLYLTVGNSLRVFALSNDKKPNEKTKLFQPPFHNCSSNGSVCLGSAKANFPEKITYSALMEYWEKMFWVSKFSHNGNETAKGNLNLIWKDKIANPLKPFDTKLLIPSKIKFKEIIS